MKRYFSLCFLILISCASGIQYQEANHPKWEKHATCIFWMGKGYYPNNKNKLSVCTIEVNERTPKLYPEWKIGKTYQGLMTFDRTVLLEPIYETIAATSTGDKKIYVKKHEDKTFKLYEVATKSFSPTPIEQLKPGRKYSADPVNGNYRQFQIYSGAYANDFKTYFVIDRNFEIVKLIEDVDNNSDREKLLPAVHSFNFTDTIDMNLNTRMVRHNKDGKLFYQTYDYQGNKIGREIPFEKVSYFPTLSGYKNAKIKNATYNMTPWIHAGGDFYIPIIHGHKNFVYDAMADHKDFVGIEIIPEKRISYSKVYSGNIELKDTKKMRPGSIVLLDKEGVYFSKLNYDFQMFLSAPDYTVEQLKKDPKNFYRTEFSLPYYSGRKSSKGFIEEQIVVYESIDNTYQIDSYNWRTQSFAKEKKPNNFKSLKEVETFLLQIQEPKIKAIQAAEKRAQESKAIRDRVAANMQASWDERDRREAQHAKKLEIMDRNERNKKPNPLLNLDIKKIFDTEGAKRRASCYRKMTNSKKAYLSGKQGWYYQGKCK